MITVVLQIDAPPGSTQAVKETLGMYLERFGDTRIVEIREALPQQMGFDNTQHNTAENRYQNQRRSK